jgi:hypothetical protein
VTNSGRRARELRRGVTALVSVLVLAGCSGTRSQAGPLPPPPPMPSLSTSPACRSADLKASADGSNGAGQRVLYGYLLTNVSTKTCALTGYPVVTAETTTGQVTPVAPTGEDFFPDQGFAPYAIPPGSGVYFNLIVAEPGLCATSMPVNGKYPNMPTYQNIRVYFIDRSIEIPTQPYQSCGQGVDAYLDQEVLPETAQLKTLVASIHMPPTVRPNSEVHYTVTLKNPTSHPVVLSACPVYSALGLGTQPPPKSIDCKSVPTIVPGQTVTLKLTVPYRGGISVPPNTVDLLWTLYSCWTCIATGNFANTQALSLTGTTTETGH